MQPNDQRDTDALVRKVVLAAHPTSGEPIPEPAATPAQLRARSRTRQSRRRFWSLIW
jgi:hypothetical protein